MGGPMMGIAQYSLETSVIKNTNAILALIEARILPENGRALDVVNVFRLVQ